MSSNWKSFYHHLNQPSHQQGYHLIKPANFTIKPGLKQIVWFYFLSSSNKNQHKRLKTEIGSLIECKIDGLVVSWTVKIYQKTSQKLQHNLIPEKVFETEKGLKQFNLVPDWFISDILIDRLAKRLTLIGIRMKSKLNDLKTNQIGIGKKPTRTTIKATKCEKPQPNAY